MSGFVKPRLQPGCKCNLAEGLLKAESIHLLRHVPCSPMNPVCIAHYPFFSVYTFRVCFNCFFAKTAGLLNFRVFLVYLVNGIVKHEFLSSVNF